MPSPNNLPLQLTSFIGREREIGEVKRLLATSRLLTFTGAGGSGKTRLALQTASQLLDEYPGGVFFVNLAPITDHNLVVSAIAQTLSVKEVAGQPLIETLKAYLQDKELLLFLDNFEQVLNAAPFVVDLLLTAPLLKVLVTSREPLHVQGEQQFLVPPLSLPDPARTADPVALSQYEAIALFVQRAQAVRADFELTSDNAPSIAEICIHLDGLPLAIELAAARISLLPPQAMISRLNSRLQLLTGGAHDLPARQQTLHNTIDWSYDLLTEAEKQLFRRLAVFMGGRTLQGIQDVCNADGGMDLKVEERVESLLGKNLLEQRQGRDGEPRFWMLETIHEYAREKLEESGEVEALRKQHALYFMRLAEEAEPQLTGAKQQEWLDRLEDEYDNLRVALQWAKESSRAEDIETGLRLAGAISRFWYLRGYYSEGREQLDRLLKLQQTREGAHANGADEVARAERLDIDGSKRYRAKALNGAGMLIWRQGDYTAARSLYEESLSLERELGDKWGIAHSLSNLGNVAYDQGDYTSARSLYEESLSLERELGDKWGIATSLNNLGDVALEQGDYTSARSLHEESLSLERELGDKYGIIASLGNPRMMPHRQGDYLAARSLYVESLSLERELGNKGGIAASLGDLGNAALEQGDYLAARSLYVESLSIRREIGDKGGIAASLGNLGMAAHRQGDYLAARSLYEESLSIWLELEDKWGIAASLGNLGMAAHRQGDYLAARSLYVESLSIRREIGDKWGIAHSLSNLGMVAHRQGDYLAARSLYVESLSIWREIGDKYGIGISLAGLGGVAVSTGGPQRGVKVLGAVEALLDELGAVLDSEDRLAYERAVASARSLLSEEAFERTWQEGQAMTIEEAIEYALKDAAEHEQIREVTSAKTPPEPSTTPKTSEPTYPMELTRRELEVLRLLVEALSNEQIAQRLFVSRNTVTSHLYSIYGKLNVSSRSAAARFAVEHNLV